MQGVLGSCHSMQSQMGQQIHESKQRLDLNTAQAQQVHLDQQRLEVSRANIAQQLSGGQERLTRTQQQHDQNFAQLQPFASQVDNQLRQSTHTDSNMLPDSNNTDWNPESRAHFDRFGPRIGEPYPEIYPRPIITQQRGASVPEIGSLNRTYGDANAPSRPESQSYIPNAKISPVSSFEVTR